MKTCTIHQPHFLPWLGYFNKLANSDVLVILDDVQYRDRYFQNRTLIDNVNGPYWFTVPVHHSRNSKISDVTLAESDKWPERFQAHLEYNYGKSEHFKEVHPVICDVLSNAKSFYLSELTTDTIFALCKAFNFQIKIKKSSELDIKGAPSERLARICARIQADAIIFGEGNGLKYHGEVVFKHTGISVVQQNFYANLRRFHQENNICNANYSVLHYIYHFGFEATKEVLIDLWVKPTALNRIDIRKET